MKPHVHLGCFGLFVLAILTLYGAVALTLLVLVSGTVALLAVAVRGLYRLAKRRAAR